METTLIVGATGNIGTAAVKGALNAGLKVLAIVRNSASADKLFQNLGTKEGITIVEADIMSDSGVQSVIDQVKEGKLPAFQHVYSTGQYPTNQLTFAGYAK
jgi:short-subunit dehydrogenase